jgi:hypothetical protein
VHAVLICSRAELVDRGRDLRPLGSQRHSGVMHSVYRSNFPFPCSAAQLRTHTKVSVSTIVDARPRHPATVLQAFRRGLDALRLAELLERRPALIACARGDAALWSGRRKPVAVEQRKGPQTYYYIELRRLATSSTFATFQLSSYLGNWSNSPREKSAKTVAHS